MGIPPHLVNTIILFLIVAIYAVNMRIPYPKWVVHLMHEPLARVVLYFILYLVACRDPVIGLLLLCLIVLLHSDMISLAKVYI